MAITAYKVLTGNSQDSLESLVNKAIAAGYQPHGTPTSDGRHLSQAVIKGSADAGGASSVTAASISDASDTGRSVLKAANPALARTAIGAGTGNSNLAVGTTAADAKAGNYVPTAAEVANGLKVKTQLVAVAAIATPASATAEQVATAFNSLLAALKA